MSPRRMFPLILACAVALSALRSSAWAMRPPAAAQDDDRTVEEGLLARGTASAPASRAARGAPAAHTPPVAPATPRLDAQPSPALSFAAEKETAQPRLDELFLLHADYGFLPASHSVVQFLRARLAALLPEVPPNELPTVQVLASIGFGINAQMFANGTMVISPEMVRFCETVEELDGLLMHELNHWTRKHHDLIKQSGRHGAMLRILGAVRYAEYEADIAAFYQMAEPQRATNPRGITRLLERMRDAERAPPGARRDIRWDPAHGSLTDLILNLKLIARLLDLLVLDQDLTPIEPTLAQSVASLPRGGRLTRLLQQPPEVGTAQEDQWSQRVEALLARADWRLLLAASNSLSLTLRSTASIANTRSLMPFEQQIQARATDLLHQAIRRLVPVVATAFSLPASHQAVRQDDAVLCALLLETGAAIPVLSRPDDVVARLGMFQPLRDACRVRRPARDLLPTLTALVIRHSPVLPMNPSHLSPLLAWAAQEALGPHAEYDENGGIDVPRYLREAAALSHAAGESAEQVWTSAVIGGALVLADVGEWAAWETRYASLIQAASSLEIVPGRISRLLDDYHRRFPERAELAHAVETYARAQWVLPLTLQQTIARLNEVLLTLLQESRRAPLVHTNPAHRALLQEAGRLLAALPVEIDANNFSEELVQEIRLKQIQKGTGGRKRVERTHLIEKLLLGNIWGVPGLFDHIASFEEVRTALAWACAMAPDEAALKEWLGGLGLELSMQLAVSLEEFEELDRLVRDPNQAEALLGLTPLVRETDVRLTQFYVWQQYALQALSARLESVTTAEGYFQQCEAFLRLWPVPSFSEPTDGGYDTEIAQWKRSIIERALAWLASAPQGAGADPITLKRLLMAACFFEDPIIRRRVHDYALNRLLPSLNVEEAITLLTRDFAPQGLFGSVRTLELLDEKAQTPQELARLKDAGREWLSQVGDPLGGMGVAVLAEGGMEALFDAPDRLSMLLALLTSSYEEQRLREVLANGWWQVYGTLIKEQLRQSLADLTRLDDLQGWAEAPPHLLSNPLISDAVEVNQTADQTKKRTSQRDLWYYSLQDALELVYRLGPMERYVLLRKLLSGEQGALATSNGRQQLLAQFFRTYVRQEANPDVVALMREVFGALFDEAPGDELYLMLEPLLSPRLGNPPSTRDSWEPQAERVAKRLLNTIPNIIPSPIPDTIFNPLEELTMERLSIDAQPYLEEMQPEIEHHLVPPLRTWLLSHMNGYAPGHTPQPGPEEQALRLIPPEELAREAKVLGPLELVVETARQLGAPGVRFLQLLGQTVPIPAEYREEFLTVYDSIKGQSKLSAWETIKRELPDYATRVKRLGKRLGGGSLFTVYEVEVEAAATDYPEQTGQVVTEVVRVLNPNALYHAQTSLKIIRAAMEQLVKQDAKYARAMPPLELIERWIAQELDDPTYEQDDASFHDIWDGWQPEGFTASVLIPRTIPTGTKYVRPEQSVPGTNFTALHTFPAAQQQELVALAAQHCVAQIMAGQVHSDISLGNLSGTGADDLVIYDRGLYLKFDAQEQLFLWQLSQAATTAARAETLVRRLWSLPENAAHTRRRTVEPTIRRITARLATNHAADRAGTILAGEEVPRAAERAADPEDAMLSILVAMHEEGLEVPLKFALLFKNLNVLHRMSRQAGFVSLAEALAWRPTPPSHPLTDRTEEALRAATPAATSP